MTTQPTPADQLAELVPLVEELGWMPSRITRDPVLENVYRLTNNYDGNKSWPHDEDALDLITAECERRLRERGWECVRLAYNLGSNYWNKEDWNLKGMESLPAALRAEIERGK